MIGFLVVSGDLFSYLVVYSEDFAVLVEDDRDDWAKGLDNLVGDFQGVLVKNEVHFVDDLELDVLEDSGKQGDLADYSENFIITIKLDHSLPH